MPLPVALFYARARGLLLGVGIIKPAEDLLPSHLAKVMSRPQGVSPQCGKIPESERGDISRFLNRQASQPQRPGPQAFGPPGRNVLSIFLLTSVKTTCLCSSLTVHATA